MSDRGGVSRLHATSLPQKLVFLSLHLAIVLLCMWLAFADGVGIVGSWLGQALTLPDPLRAGILLACAVLYFVRHGITLFYLMMRRVDWGEVFGLAAFFFVFEVGLLVVGAGLFREAPVALRSLDLFALVLLLVGSCLNTGSELQRKRWKSDPANQRRCYRQGLFSQAMHINYFGDVVLFSGWCLLTAAWWTLGLPLLMLVMFAFIHIPPLDEYLSERYGQEFDDYRVQTKRLIPFVW